MNLRRLAPVIFVAVALSTALAACGTPSDSGNATSGSTSSAQPSTSLAPDDLKIAFFSAGTNNTYLQAGIAGAKEAAKAAGAEIDVFDGKFDAQEQFNQMQSALTSGKYNVFVVEPNDGNLVCNLLSKQAVEKDILVSVFNQPICDRATKAGDEVWQPGTVTYVGGQTLDVYNAWIDRIIQENPDGGKVAVISGPDLNANTINLNTALKKLDGAGFSVVANQKTDYSTPKAYAAAQTMLQANRDLDLIISNYSGMTQGVVQAAKAGNRLGSVKIYDMGGNKWALGAVADGQLAQTVIFLPRQEGFDAVDAVIKSVQGKEVPKFINLTESDVLPGTPFVTKDNVSKFTPEY